VPPGQPSAEASPLAADETTESTSVDLRRGIEPGSNLDTTLDLAEAPGDSRNLLTLEQPLVDAELNDGLEQTAGVVEVDLHARDAILERIETSTATALLLPDRWPPCALFLGTAIGLESDPAIVQQVAVQRHARRTSTHAPLGDNPLVSPKACGEDRLR
jgi:hypothetical protein